MKYYIYFIIIFVVLLFSVGIYKNVKTYMQPNLEIDKSKYTPSDITSIIPLDIYQTWHTKKLPKYMKKCAESLQADNPEFKYHLYDDDDCRNFINNNFDNDVLYAYDSLIPGAYKADLWRYCILYKRGGVYLDIKYKCINGFKLITLTDDEYYVQDRYNVLGKRGIYNAFMICKPGNTQMIKCINQIVENVKTRDYWTNPLEVTGPLLLIKFLTPGQIKNLRIKLDADEVNQKFFLLLDNNPIITMYPEYRAEQKKTQKTKYYDILWREKNIYK